jgi:hypothetical protein
MNNFKIVTTINSENKIIKRIWKIGTKTVVIIDESIVKKLGISEVETLVEQIITKDGILMRLNKLEHKNDT